jgi:LacI family transcriptional regulator
LIIGIARYVRSHKPWTFFAPSLPAVAPVPSIQDWKGDGVIAQVTSEERQAEILALKIPAVNVSGALEKPVLPSLRTDTRLMGQVAFEHFQSRGFDNFAFFGYPNSRLSDRREKMFRAAVEAAGYVCQTYVRSIAPKGERTADWEAEQSSVARWLESLPKPVGIFCLDDFRGRHAAAACRHAKLSIPEEVAIVGINNDIMVCELNNPPLSSLDLRGEQIGFEAAKLLAALMDGAPPPKAPIELPPGTVIVRQSSDIMAVPDGSVAAALRYIHDHIEQPLYVDEIARAAGTSRRLLERKFRRELDSTINKEIVKVRLQRVRHLLTNTDKPIPEVAAATGFIYVQQLNQLFKRVTGYTPTAFRRLYRMS